MAQKVAGVNFPVNYTARRMKDPPVLVVDASKVKEKLK